MKTLNGKQKEILRIIKESFFSFGYAPTVRELAVAIGVKSPRAVSHHLDCLEKKGFLRRTKEDARNILLVVKDPSEPVRDVIKVPLVGWTAGGDAILAEENILDWVPISTKFFKTGSDDIFLLKVKGDSMSPKIEDGDIIIVRKQYTANLGQTVVALLGSETTVKKYIPREDHIVLQPANLEYEPVVVFPDELRIQGVVQGVLKYY